MRTTAIFFSLTFVISWSLFISASALSPDNNYGEPFFSVANLIYLLGVFTPALVAVFLCWQKQGEAGVVGLLSNIFRAPTHFKWYAFAIGYYIAIKLVATVIYRIVAGQWPAFGHEPILLIVAGVIISTPFQAGEEIGWRAFALPRLSTHFGLALASIFLGIIWAAWHLPFFFFSGTDKSGQSFPVYSLSVVALSVSMAWLYWRSQGSLLLVMLQHAAINNTTGIVPSVLPGAGNVFSIHASAVAWISTALLWIFAIYFLIQMRHAKISAQ